MISPSQKIEMRLKTLGVLILVLTAVLVWRMFDIQVTQHDYYQSLALGQHRFEKTEIGQRGKILVHDSEVDQTAYYPLAFDLKKFAVWVVPRQITDKAAAASSLSAALGLPKDDVFAKINNDKLYIPPIKTGLSLDEATALKDKNLAGTFVMPEYSRFYPEGNLASQLLGFVNHDGKGNYGFEGHFNQELTGKNGNTIGEKDTLGRIINLLQENDPQDGASYVLTIDRSVQYYAEQKLKQAITDTKADSGSVIIMDIKTGGILAMANSPDFDPNNYKDQADKDPALFMNPSISSVFEPGSIFKPLVMSAALDQGLVTPETENTFAATVTVDGYVINTAERKAFGLENMTQVLEHSDNVAMVWVADQVGNDTLYRYIKEYGFLDKTGIELDGEVSGFAPTLKNWRDITRATIGFGQGITATPLQIVAAYAAVANGGVYLYPHIVDSVISSDGKTASEQVREGQRILKQETATALGEMLYNVVQNGTGKKAKVPGFKVGVKTGTAQIPKADGSGYESSDDGLGIYVHTLAGFAPVGDPRFAMLVKLDRPRTSKYAETTVAPVFGEISSFLLNYHYRLTPTEPVD